MVVHVYARNTMINAMHIKTILLLCFFLVSISTLTYAQESDSISSAMFDKIIQLKEFKAEDERAELLMAAGNDVMLTISVPLEPLDPKDRERGILRVYINRRQGDEEITLYEIHFDRKTQEIVAIENKQE